MSRRGTNAGRIVQVIDGIHKGKTGIAYHKDQHDQIRKQKKICVTIDADATQAAPFPHMQETEAKKVLFDPTFLKLIGYVD